MSTNKSTVLVTGATSGIGLEAAAQLADAGYTSVIITGRSAQGAATAMASLIERTGRDVFSSVELDLGDPASIDAAVKTLAGTPIDALVLNAGMLSPAQQQVTIDGVELTFASTLVGHHRLTMHLLAAGGLSPQARIVIAGSEGARGDVPLMTLADLDGLAAEHHDGDLAKAAEEVIRGTLPKKFKPNDTYATSKLFVAWWASALARRLPEGMAVNAVSPGSTPGTGAGRNAGFLTQKVMVPMLKILPKRFNMAAPVSASAGRYLDALQLPASSSGRFYASKPKQMSGPVQVMDYPHLDNTEHQEAAWSATVTVAGIGTPA